MKRIVSSAVALALVLAVFLLTYPMFFPWSKLHCSDQEIDITTGRIRYTEYRLYRKVSERIEETELSEVLADERSAAVAPEWHTVNRFSPGVRHSPHYVFHGAFAQLTHLKMAWRTVEDDRQIPVEEFKRTTARHLLALWQFDQGDDHAGLYLDYLLGMALDTHAFEALRNLSKIEMPLVQTDGKRVTKTVLFPNGIPIEQCEGYTDASGKFVRDGLRELWRKDGTRQLYDHWKDGELNGQRLEWDHNGKLSTISNYQFGGLHEYQSENVEIHPAFEEAQRLSKAIARPK